MTKRKTLTSTFYNTPHAEMEKAETKISTTKDDILIVKFGPYADGMSNFDLVEAKVLVDQLITAIHAAENRDSKRRALIDAMSDEDLQILGLTRE